MLMKAKLFRMMAFVFAGAGFVMFLVMFYSKGSGSIIDMFSKISTIALVTVPFLPAVFLSYSANKMDKALKKYLETGQTKVKKDK